jgi:phosphoenolpyruvate-protein phosphotransferase (PTS system enzyme I)
MSGTEKEEVVLRGIGGSPGICIGKAYLVDKEGVDVVEKYYIQPSLVKDEVNRFKAAVQRSQEELAEIIAATPEEFKEHAHILETHLILLKDKMIYRKTIQTIEKEKVNAEWALKKVVAVVKPMFEGMSDAYLRARAEDISHVADRIMAKLVGAEGVNIAAIDKRVVLVARDLSPADTVQIQLERIKGFVTDFGGKASHTSIIARSLEIPAVLGLERATSVIHNEDIVIVDGTDGTVTVNPGEHTLFEAEDRRARYEAYRADIARTSFLPADTIDRHHIKIMGNIELPEEVVSVINYGGDGIGLYRTEFQYLSRPDFPGENELFEKYKDVVDVMPDRPVTIRTLDINGDKAVAYISGEAEVNPALGLRAIRYCLKNPKIFKTQLRAILRAAWYGNVRILFPMISIPEEVIEAKRLLNEAAECLDKAGVRFKADIPIGIMIEVPSAVVTADLIAREVDFFSIGTNDLIQYTLAIDRSNQHVAHLYHPLHPAVLRMLKRICDVAREAGIQTYICGEMASEPAHLPILLGLGIEELSMNPQSIPVIKGMIRSLRAEDTRAFVAEALKMERAADIISLVEKTYGGIISRTIYSD